MTEKAEASSRSPATTLSQPRQQKSIPDPIRTNWPKLALAILLTCASITIVIPPNPARHSSKPASTTASTTTLKDAYVADHTVARAAFAGTAGLLMLLVTYALPFHLAAHSHQLAARLARVRATALGFYHPRLVTPLNTRLAATEIAAALVCLCGAALRHWAFRTLAEKFTYAVVIFADHELITAGPYTKLLHPGYTGLLMAMSGLFWYMGFRGWRYVGLVGVYLGPLLVRMRDEERVMAEHFGEQRWGAYVRGRDRLVPYVW